MKNPKKQIVWLFILAASFFWLWRIHLGLFHDEVQIINYGKLLVDGDSFIQFAGVGLSHYLLYPLMYVYHAAVGSYDGVVLFLRVWFVIGQMLVSTYMYTTCRLFWNEKQATAAALLTCLFIFNHSAISYKSVWFWGTILLILFLMRRFKDGGIRYVVWAAITLSLTVLAYPSAAILLIPASVFLVRHDRSPRQSVLVLWAGCGLCAVLFCMAIFTRYSFSDVINTYFRVGYFRDRGFSPALRKLLLLAALYAVSEIALLLWRKEKLPLVGKVDLETIIAAVFWLAQAGLILAKPWSAQDSRLWYAYLFLTAVFFCLKTHGLLRACEQAPIDLLFDMSLYSFAAIALLSNQGIAIVAHGAIYALIGSCIVLLEEKPGRQRGARLLAGSILLSMFLCATIFVCDENEMIASSNVFQVRTRINEGPGKGIYVTAYTHDVYDSIYLAAKKYAREDDRMLIVSDYYRVYGTMSADVVEAMPCGFLLGNFLSTDLGESYCARFPDRSPTLVLIDTSFVGPFELWIGSIPFGHYLEEHFDLENCIHDGRWVVLRLPEKT